MKPGTTELPPRRHARLLLIGEHDATGSGGLQVSVQAATVVGATVSAIETSIRIRTGAGTRRSPFPHAVLPPQLSAALSRQPDAVGLAATGDERLVSMVAEALSTESAPCLIDANLVDRDGQVLLDDPAVDVLRRHLIQMAELFIVNVHDLELLTGRGADEPSGMKDGARRLHDLGAEFVLVTGGRIEGHAIDIFFDGDGFIELGADRVRVSQRLRGAGACLLGAVAGHRARGDALLDSLDRAKKLTHAAIVAAAEGPGGPVVQPAIQAWQSMDIDPTPHVELHDPGSD